MFLILILLIDVFLIEYAVAAVKILEQAKTRETRLTGLKLVEALMGRGTSNLKLAGWQVSQSSSWWRLSWAGAPATTS